MKDTVKKYDKQVHGRAGIMILLVALFSSFKPPYTKPNREDCCWSRGNGWVFAALVRVLKELPLKSVYRTEIIHNFTDRAEALVRVQRSNSFRNVSLHDPGSGPHEGQPVTYNLKSDFEDNGPGCFMLAGSEVYKLTG